MKPGKIRLALGKDIFRENKVKGAHLGGPHEQLVLAADKLSRVRNL